SGNRSALGVRHGGAGWIRRLEGAGIEVDGSRVLIFLVRPQLYTIAVIWIGDLVEANPGTIAAEDATADVVVNFVRGIIGRSSEVGPLRVRDGVAAASGDRQRKTGVCGVDCRYLPSSKEPSFHTMLLPVP